MVCLSGPTAPPHDAAGVVLAGDFFWDFARPLNGRRPSALAALLRYNSKRMPIRQFYFYE
jgi:hypothetical protein